MELYLILTGWTTVCLCANLKRVMNLLPWLCGVAVGCTVFLLVPAATAIPAAHGSMLQALLASFVLLQVVQQSTALLCGGIIAGALIGAQPPVAFWLIPLAPLTTAFALFHDDFADMHMRDEALLVVLGSALLLATIPEMQANWSAAGVMQASELVGEQVQQSIQEPLLLSGVSLILGLLYARWRYR